MDSSQNSSQQRRIFLQRALTAAGITLSAGAINTILVSCEQNESTPTPPVDPGGIKILISDYPELTGPGTIIAVTISGLNAGAKVFISQVEETRFAVFSTTCTHAGCEVALPFEPGQDCFCPCHASTFSPTTGAVTRGPAKDSLQSFASTFNASTGILTVTP